MPVDQKGVYFHYLTRRPIYNIAFATDYQEDDTLRLLFAGVKEPMLHCLFCRLCGNNGIANGYTIEYRQSPVWRNGYICEWMEVTLTGFLSAMVSIETLCVMIEEWFRRGVRTNFVDIYRVEDFLNLRGHSPELMLNGPKNHSRKKKTIKNEEEMANIYLKVPWYVAWHFRGRNEGHQLTEWEPVKFNDFDHEFQVMVNNLRYIPEQNQSRMCYSQHVWKNILHGKMPVGGKVILQRDPKEWPTVNETAVLTGTQMSGRHSASDYLCIEMPKEVWLNKKVHRTTSSYSLSYDVAYYLSAMLTDRFAYEYTQWMDQDFKTARSQGFKRKIIESQERYFTQYNFPVIIDPKLRESLRRQHSRFMERGYSKPRYCFHFGQESQKYMEHIGEHEQRRIEENKKSEKQ